MSVRRPRHLRQGAVHAAIDNRNCRGRAAQPGPFNGGQVRPPPLPIEGEPRGCSPGPQAASPASFAANNAGDGLPTR
jgi:hypothetical protein